MAEGERKPRKIWWLVALLAAVTLSLVASNLYLLLDRRPAPPDQAQRPDEPAAAPKSPIFVEVEPFTVNLQGTGHGTRLLYAGLSLKVGNKKTRDFLQEHMPLLRSRLLMLLAGQPAEEVVTPEGQQALTARILAALDTPLTTPQPKLEINDVLFTEFIVQ